MPHWLTGLGSDKVASKLVTNLLLDLSKLIAFSRPEFAHLQNEYQLLFILSLVLLQGKYLH